MTLNIWTDGSCNNNSKQRVGAFGIVYDWKGDIHTHVDTATNTTSNRMELSGIIYALKSIQQTPRLIVNIHSDSQYCIRTINNRSYQSWIHTNDDVKNKDLWIEMMHLCNQMNQFKKINFVWIKGHAGEKYPLNELADQLAGQARKNLIKSLEGANL